MSTTSLHVLIHIRDALCAPFHYFVFILTILTHAVFGSSFVGSKHGTDLIQGCDWFGAGVGNKDVV